MTKNKINSFIQTFELLRFCYRTLQEAKEEKGDLKSLKEKWAAEILRRVNVNLQIVGEPTENKQHLFVGNHVSYLDIPIVMLAARNVCFLAKQEINSWPIFGAGARAMETVFVKRENGSSRKAARQSIGEALGQGRRLVIFPSGTTCLQEQKPWRRGVFELARDQGISIQPFRLSYQPPREAAYIDRDFFPTHLYKLMGFGQIQAKIEFHEPVTVSSHPAQDAEYWQAWSRTNSDIKCSGNLE